MMTSLNRRDFIARLRDELLERLRSSVMLPERDRCFSAPKQTEASDWVELGGVAGFMAGSESVIQSGEGLGQIRIIALENGFLARPDHGEWAYPLKLERGKIFADMNCKWHRNEGVSLMTGEKTLLGTADEGGKENEQ